MIHKIRYREYSPDMPQAKELAATAGISPLTAAVALNRGISSSESLSVFLEKSVYSLHSPFLMKGMDQAVETIRGAVSSGKKITIYGDYDVDGITSVAILVKYLSGLGAEVSFYIPSRETEGYGLNCDAVKSICDSGCELIITVDTGITACDEVAYAKELGMEVVVTDHHQCPDVLPDCTVVNPHRSDCPYPFKALSGVGVVFKLLCALENEFAVKILDMFGDIIATGTIADVVDLTDENRIIVDFGLKKLQSAPNTGLDALINISGLRGRSVDASTVGFTLAPRINAAGRIGNPEKAVQLLLSDNLSQCMELAKYLDEENRDRQLQEAAILRDAEQMVENDPSFRDKSVLILSGYGWHHGIIGIVASRITNKYYKPCLLISCDDGVGKGSGRSVPGFNLFDAMKSCGDVFTKYGGHELAAGFTLPPENIAALDQAINKYAEETMTEESKTPFTTVEFELAVKFITVEDIDNLRLLEPFGVSNPKPCFICSGVRIAGKRPMGDKGQHIKLILAKDGTTFEAVAFRRPDINEKYNVNDYISVTGTLTVNEWNNTYTPQLIIADILPPPDELKNAPGRDLLAAVYRHLKSFGEQVVYTDLDAIESALSRDFGFDCDADLIVSCLEFFSRTGVASFNMNFNEVSVTILK
ncbi:MAG: single-stranded-DNA-specific exonuclease RecJ [Clostridia bacterium]|nr:single-stranded-DNA-specific exonuclease RecJ [Clostridia bacterium]